MGFAFDRRVLMDRRGGGHTDVSLEVHLDDRLHREDERKGVVSPLDEPDKNTTKPERGSYGSWREYGRGSQPL